MASDDPMTATDTDTLDPLPDRFHATPPTYDQARANRIIARFVIPDNVPDAAEIEAFGRKTLEGDPLADAMMAVYQDLGHDRARKLLDQALNDGIESIDDPPEALAALFREVDAEPEWLDWDLIEHASTIFCRTGWASNLVLRNLSLMGGYGFASINKPLVFTGALHSSANRRIAETKSFWVDCSRPGAMRRFGIGFKAAVRVRVMHAALRVRIQAHPGWSNQRWGLPINQADLIATNIGFSSVYIVGMMVLGQQLTAKDRRAILHYWRYNGYLLGIDLDFLPVNMREAARVFYLMNHVLDEPDDDSRAMATALYNQPLHEARSKPGLAVAYIARAYHTAISNLLLSRRQYRALGLPLSPLVILPILALPGVTVFELIRRALPPVNRFAIWWGIRAQAWAMKYHLAGVEAAYKPVDQLAVDKD